MTCSGTGTYGKMRSETMPRHFRNAMTACLLPLLLISCAGAPPAPKNPDNICQIFREHRDWYPAAYKASRKWGIPIPVMMAIMYQESRYESTAKPPRTTCLFFFPGARPSTAYGYAQALDTTWDRYQRETGRWGADRDDFADAMDFIGWYCNVSRVRCNIAAGDAYGHYLAYHEGHGGYRRKSYRNKTHLKRIARSVSRRSKDYSGQLASCEGEFMHGKGCCLWPF